MTNTTNNNTFADTFTFNNEIKLNIEAKSKELSRFPYTFKKDDIKTLDSMSLRMKEYEVKKIVGLDSNFTYHPYGHSNTERKVLGVPDQIRFGITLHVKILKAELETFIGGKCSGNRYLTYNLIRLQLTYELNIPEFNKFEGTFDYENSRNLIKSSTIGFDCEEDIKWLGEQDDLTVIIKEPLHRYNKFDGCDFKSKNPIIEINGRDFIAK